MLSDEPYRWAEAVSNRRDYIEDQLRRGSPIVGVGYEDGVLLLTLGQGQQKVFEVYNQIAMGAIGHSTDIEKLRQAAIDMAHLIGFNYSATDVTLRQIVHFGMGPTMKTSFDEVVRSPYLVRLLLAELDGIEGSRTFYTVDYDGSFHKSEGWGVVGGFPEADRMMRPHVSDLESESLSLQDAVEAALTACAAGRVVGQLEEVPADDAELEEAVKDVNLKETIRTDLESLDVEAAVLEKSRNGKNKYRALGAEEIEPVVDKIRQDSD